VATVDDAGRFEFNGLFSGSLALSLDTRNWKLSNANRSLDLLNGWRMVGLLEADKSDLLLIIEKGQYDYSSGSIANGQLPAQDRPENNPLSGAEKSGQPAMILAGQVLDDKTGQPLAHYRIVPGYKPPVGPAGPLPGQKPILQSILSPFTKKLVPIQEQPYWMFGRTETNAQANFAVEFASLSSKPMLRIEADDYLPFETEPCASTTSNLVIRLKPGTGPDGVVLLPDGKPAEGATVVYAIEKEQFGFSDRKLSTYNRGKQLITGKDGRFSFPMRAHGRVLFVAHAAGWAEESVERGGENLKLRLQPWAVLRGTLLDTNGQAMAGVELALTMPHDWQRGDPFLNFQGQATTDAQGRFQFAGVPPRRLEVQRKIPFGLPPSRGWTYRMQTWLVAQPGTNELGNVTYDQPPPAPLFEQIKKTIGL
jgi:protocatechuate 3,4-dioxygenase beta subunit